MRKVLSAAGGRDMAVHRPPGYLLSVTGDAVDAERLAASRNDGGTSLALFPETGDRPGVQASCFARQAVHLLPGLSAYSASKEAMRAFAHVLAADATFTTSVELAVDGGFAQGLFTAH